MIFNTDDGVSVGLDVAQMRGFIHSLEVGHLGIQLMQVERTVQIVDSADGFIRMANYESDRSRRYVSG